MFFLLHGDNEFEISERVADFKQKIGDDSMRDLNITVLDGRKTTLSEVQHAADSIPFLADKRLVIVEGLLTRLASRKPKIALMMLPLARRKISSTAWSITCPVCRTPRGWSSSNFNR